MSQFEEMDFKNDWTGELTARSGFSKVNKVIINNSLKKKRSEQFMQTTFYKCSHCLVSHYVFFFRTIVLYLLEVPKAALNVLQLTVALAVCTHKHPEVYKTCSVL